MASLQKFVSLRQLKEADFERLFEWLNAPHLKPFYMWDPVSRNDITRKFQPRVDGEDDCRCLIAYIDDEQFGYIQWYLNRSVPEYGAGTIGETDGVSFDYFIGDAHYLGKGLGTEMLTCAVEKIVSTIAPKDRIFFVAHQPENKAAIKCSKRAGFVRQEQRNFMENSKHYHLYSRDLRDE